MKAQARRRKQAKVLHPVDEGPSEEEEVS